MNWKSIAYLCLFGAAMGIFSVFGLTEGIELLLWIVIALISAVIIARMTNQKLFIHGLYSGIGMGIVHGALQSSLFTIYSANNPTAIDRMTNLPMEMSIQLFILISSPMIGGAYGIVVGMLSTVAGKFHKPK